MKSILLFFRPINLQPSSCLRNDGDFSRIPLESHSFGVRMLGLHSSRGVSIGLMLSPPFVGDIKLMFFFLEADSFISLLFV